MRYLMIIALLAAVCLLFAIPVSQSTALQAAQNWTARYAPADIQSRSFSKITPYPDAQNPALYLFETEHSFVLTSADDSALPIIAYSFDTVASSPEGQPANPAFLDYLRTRQAEIAQIRALRLDNAYTSTKWQQAVSNDFPREETRAINPLLTTTWNQGWPYNMLCPVDAAGPGGHVYAGCVASAMAQVMKYWNWPITGQGSHSYYAYGYGNQSVNFGNTTYLWDQMPLAVGTPNDPVARLMYQAAVSVDMDFAPDGSGAQSYDAASSLRQHFRYNTSLQILDRSDYSLTTWESMLRAELDDVHPMYYSGSGDGGGHAFVCDGYQNTNFFHFNWGWGGSQDGYFYVNNLNPGSDFSWYQSAIFDVHPLNYSLSSVRLSLNGTDCSVGDAATINVVTYPLLPSWNIHNASFTMEFDPDQVHYTGFSTVGTRLEGATVVDNSQPGLVSFTVSSPTTAIAGGGNLIKLNFVPIEPGSYGFNMINFMFGTTAVTTITQTSINVTAGVTEPQNSTIDLINAMHIPAGQIATMPVTTTFVLPSWNVRTADFIVNYPADKLQWNGFDTEGCLTAGAEVTMNDTPAGTLSFDIAWAATMIGSGNLIKLKFLAIGNTSGTSLATVTFSEFHYNAVAVTNLLSGYVVLSPVTGTEDNPPVYTNSFSAYPNPFRGSSTIRLSTAKNAAISSIDIYNLKGQLVKKLYNQHSQTGVVELLWNGDDDAGNHAPAGIYLLKASSGSYSQTQKLLKL